jgi:aldehyde:ferredoxin oxidoreductase
MVLLVICQFLYCPAWRVYVPDQLVAGVYTITAWDVSLSKLIRVDKLRVNLMADFNTRKGIGKKTALLPLRFYQPLLDGQSKGYTVDPAEFENAMNILLHFGLLGY